MTKIPESTIPFSDRATKKLSRILSFVKAHLGILAITFLFASSEARAATETGTYNVSLAWDIDPDPTITGYRLHSGVESGNYTSSVVIGNVSSYTLAGLERGTVYYFVITAINSIGLESDYSNEVSFLPGLEEASIQLAANGAVDLLIYGIIGQTYDIEATEDMETWTFISNITITDGGSYRFSDPNAAAFKKRFYRTRKSP